MCEHTFSIQIDGQTVVEQCRGQVEADSTTGHACGFQSTVIVQETCADTIRHLEGLAA